MQPEKSKAATNSTLAIRGVSSRHIDKLFANFYSLTLHKQKIILLLTDKIN
jgi:hypothetical protein